MRRILPLLIISLLLAGGIWAEENSAPYSEALRHLIERAEGGEAKAIYELAKLHDTGYDTIPVDSARSTALYLKAAEKGYSPAMNFIGFRYYTGEGIHKDLDSALYWIRKAADAGDLTAATNLGYLLTEGEGVAHDEEEAAKWLTIASEGGVREAQVNLVKLMKEKWKALTPDSALNLGTRYYVGAAPIPGVALIEIAATNEIPKAYALLGDAYSKGRGTTYDHQKSIEYFYRAAAGGDPSAQFILAELIEIFPDALSSLPEEPATEGLELGPALYEKAAESGVTDSESAYNRLYSVP